MTLSSGDAMAQSFTLDLGGDTSSTARIVQLVALITVLSLAPSMLIMVTSFTRIVIVFHFVRVALGTQGTPPNQVLVSLALFLTFFIMTPTFEAAYDQAIKPLMDGEMEEIEAFERATVPFHDFMMRHVREADLLLFTDMANVPETVTGRDIPMKALIPAFMISELRRAFEIGFLIFVPFLVIDMVVASVLMSMGMMMLPPIMVSMPFKIIFFVLVDGWYLLVGSLVKSYGG
ncbi:MAG: flagellar type III secretion system pore protein FliP [Rhodospirillales bacterium]|nr:flagellar type III secretion system pore protein FliP [Rhodospirillales bacterium]MCW8861061.1 flagellar type III secretion system pore protein FliP [Rhodospirillales bacterium]MCW8951897.1 flagellar type III secretion system pore protein FliP [Rhodospirillales bacterium]MCW9002905.1 flagellar type III secretion system pore protein FliP [Rhodospirillales bacterium]